MIKVYTLALAATPKRLSEAYGPGATEAANIPYRQLVITASGDAYIGDATVTVVSGVPATSQLTLGPFETGPVKLSDLYGVGAGASLYIMGVPF
jgi:hypothetical protein